MNILNFENENFDELQFNDETLIVMAHQRKIITINDHEEMWKIKYIMEEISDGMENNEEECIDEYYKSEIVSMLVDGMEQESWFLESKDIEPRKLKIFNVEKDENRNFDSRISVFYGYLNSRDTYILPEEYKLIGEELENFALNSGRCKPETKELLLKLSNELTLEYKAYEENKEYFKVAKKK